MPSTSVNVGPQIRGDFTVWCTTPFQQNTAVIPVLGYSEHEFLFLPPWYAFGRRVMVRVAHSVLRCPYVEEVRTGRE